MKLFTKRLLSLLSVVLVMCACGGGKTTAAATAKNGGVNWEMLMQDTNGGPEEAQIIVAKEPTVVEDFFKNVNKHKSPDIAIPKVDYNKQMLLIICMGQRTSGGYEIGVKDITETASTITVTVEEKSPEPGAMVTAMLTEPFCVVKLKATDKKIIFKKV